MLNTKHFSQNEALEEIKNIDELNLKVKEEIVKAVLLKLNLPKKPTQWTEEQLKQFDIVLLYQETKSNMVEMFLY